MSLSIDITKSDNNKFSIMTDCTTTTLCDEECSLLFVDVIKCTEMTLHSMVIIQFIDHVYVVGRGE